MPASALRRWTSEGGAPAQRRAGPSREGSCPQPSTPEVRCGCQYFQSDSLLPDRLARALAATQPNQARSDHEYEPIGKPVDEPVMPESPEPRPGSAPALDLQPPPPPAVLVSDHEDPELIQDDASSTTSHERRFLRADDADVAQQQREIEDRYFVDTPTTPESRTDCEISTSQVDSSALENLPLKKESRKRSSVGAEASKLGQRISTQTGRLKTKLKSIKRPHMPDRPKLNMPERMKFKMPERPKFARPKINLPEMPKISLPERPKLLDKKFSLPDKPKFLDKKFSLPERPRFISDKSRFKFPDRPKINFSGFGKKEKPSSDAKSESTSETREAPKADTPLKKRILDFDFRTYPRFSRFKKDKKTPKADRPGTPPPEFATMPRVTKDRQAVILHWEASSNASGAEEPRQYGLPKGYPSQSDRDFESKLAQVDKDYNQMQQEYEEEISKKQKAKLENAEIWNAIEKNSVQRMEHRASLPCYVDEEQAGEQPMEPGDDESSAASTGHHRRGVLEEIDNDEFFLRQKGISQDNIEVGRYLTDEIRDAFRSPVNALSQMDTTEKPIPRAYVDMSDVEPNHNNLRIPSEDMFVVEQIEIDEDEDHNDMIEHDDGYYTFPPVRPSRSRKMKARAEEQEPIITAPAMFQEEPRNGDARKGMFGSFKDNDVLENLNEYENEMDQTKYSMPAIPKRKKKPPKGIKYPDDGEEFNGSYDPEKWNAMKNGKMADDEIIVHRMEYVVPVGESVPESPVPPRRERSRSRGSRTISACDDDRTSRGADSLTQDSRTNLPVTEADADFLDDIEDYPGYAVVDKVAAQKVEPPPRPPAPVRRHRSTKSLSGDRQFFTVPRALKEASPPKRPTRNYSTLGPSRPPRKKSSASLTDLPPIKRDRRNRSNSEVDSTQYVEIDDDEGVHKSLQSGEVMKKMKDRPLPPPPRPPRGPRRKKDSDDRKDDDAAAVEAELAVEDFQAEINGFQTEAPRVLENVQSPSFEEYDQDEIVEIEVSTQTDPLPDDFDYTIGMDEPFTDSQKDTMIEYLDDPEENSIDAEILHKGLQRFRESSRPESRSSRPRTPVEKPKTPLSDRPMSPTAMLLERRVDSPTKIDDYRALITEASLTVVPIEEPVQPAQPVQTTRPETPSRHSQIWEALNARYQIEEPSPVEEVIQQRQSAQPQAPAPTQQHIPTEDVAPITTTTEVLKTQRLQVADLEVERLSVSELQASKILVSEIEGLSLQVTDINSKSGNIVVRGIELAPGVFDDLLQRFAQMNPPSAETSTQTYDTVPPRPQCVPTDPDQCMKEECPSTEQCVRPEPQEPQRTDSVPDPGALSPPLENQEVPFDCAMPSTSDAPERPPLPHLPMGYAMGYFPEYSIPPGAFYRMRPPSTNLSDENRAGPTRRRRPKREPEPASSSDDDCQSPRRHQTRHGEQASVGDLSSQLFRACQSSMGRTLRYILSYITSHFNSGENKKDMQMALVIVLVMIAGLILLGIGDGKTVHHHHWDFYNPPNNNN